MGWCSWNAYHRDFNASSFTSAADAMAANGMKAAGYEYINVDGGWWAGSDTGTIVRNASGFATYNPSKYPHGIKAVVDYVHSKGFKYGHCEHYCIGRHLMDIVDSHGRTDTPIVVAQHMYPLTRGCCPPRKGPGACTDLVPDRSHAGLPACMCIARLLGTPPTRAHAQTLTLASTRATGTRP